MPSAVAKGSCDAVDIAGIKSFIHLALSGLALVSLYFSIFLAGARYSSISISLSLKHDGDFIRSFNREQFDSATL
jgi:hypothetical protein